MQILSSVIVACLYMAPLARKEDSSSVCASMQDFCAEDWVRKQCPKTCATVSFGGAPETGNLPVEAHERC